MGRIKNAPEIGAYVYIFNSPIIGVYKIGVSSNPAKRLTEVPHTKHVITSAYFLQRAAAYRVEAALHYDLQHHQVHRMTFRGRDYSFGNEWFILSLNKLCDVCIELLEYAHEWGVTPTSYAIGMSVLERQRQGRNFARGYAQRSRQGDDE